VCVYSLIADHTIDKWTNPPYWQPVSAPSGVPIPNIVFHYPLDPILPSPLTQEEVNDLRKLLERAKKYDQETGQKDYELEDKKNLLKELAKQMGVELEL
jgi:hypothetical protein